MSEGKVSLQSLTAFCSRLGPFCAQRISYDIDSLLVHTEVIGGSDAHVHRELHANGCGLMLPTEASS